MVGALTKKSRNAANKNCPKANERTKKSGRRKKNLAVLLLLMMTIRLNKEQRAKGRQTNAGRKTKT